jgi:hypothetical protein
MSARTSTDRRARSVVTLGGSADPADRTAASAGGEHSDHTAAPRRRAPSRRVDRAAAIYPPAGRLVITCCAPAVVVYDAARRARRAESSRAWRARRKRGRTCILMEISAEQLDMACRFGGLAEYQSSDPTAIARAIGRLVDHGIEALRRETARGRKFFP